MKIFRYDFVEVDADSHRITNSLKLEDAIIISPRSKPLSVEHYVNEWRKAGSQRYSQASLLLRDALKTKSGNLWVPQIREHMDYYSIQWPIGSLGIWSQVTFTSAPEEKPDPPEPEFEVDLVEPLVGWKVLDFENGYLKSQFIDHLWPANKHFQAHCFCSRTTGSKPKNHKPPAVHGTCGIYAVDKLEELSVDYDDDTEVTCEVYGWGRYVRGESGWRAGKAYVKAIYLRANQWTMVEPLKKYGVPITLDIPTPVYNPEEDGYEHG